MFEIEVSCIKNMRSLHLALDWTPNINHIGFFIAKRKGFYTNEDIDLTISTPGQDNYQVTPAKKVELGEADLALCPLESILSYQSKKAPFDLKAIATIFKEDLSAITVKKETVIKRPRHLDGATYASYKARYEDHIVQEMIKNDGGEGTIKVVYPEKLGIWNTLLTNTYDATWIFLNWEGADTRVKEAGLTYFKMKDYQIPYSYSPVIATSAELIHTQSGALTSFLEATKQGYLYAVTHPKEAIEILREQLTEEDHTYIDLDNSLSLSKDSFGNEDNWGVMEPENVQKFLDWIKEKGLENHHFTIETIMTNALL